MREVVRPRRPDGPPGGPGGPGGPGDRASPLGVWRRPPPRLRPPPADVMDTLVVLICCVFISVSGLRVTELTVPPYVDVRESATLVCHYNLQNATLNSVKWYKDEREFFRFTPGMSPPTKAFPLNGINLDLSPAKSFETQVTLRPLSYNTTGTYRCEVSADAPKFETVHRESNMTVMALPRDRPSIQGVEKAYTVGQFVKANCTADKSYPPASLQWIINGRSAQRWQVGSHNSPYRPENNPYGLQSNTLGLSFQLDRSHFPDGRIELKCVSSISNVPSLTKENAVIAMLDTNQKLAQRSSSTCLSGSPKSIISVAAICVWSFSSAHRL